MITLTINPDKHSRIYHFDQPNVSIGAEADLALPGEQLQGIHVKITRQQDSFVITNVANDPFVTLNDFPFGKKILANHDLLQIGKTKVCIEIGVTAASHSKAKEFVVNDLDALFLEVEKLDASETEKPNTSELAKLEAPQSSELMDKLDASATTPTQVEIPDLLLHEIFEAPIERSLEKEDSFQEKEPDQTFAEQESKDEEIPALSLSKPATKSQNNWRAFFAACIAMIIVITITATVVYFRVNTRSEKEKIIAAEGVSDVAMALAYAQINHIRPQQQNWFDPDFIKNNLASVLSPGYPSFANIDNQGQFRNCPYILRIYTSSDLLQFLVIAQPEPSLLQWLVPKATIVVDSTDMEMRNIEDVKPLNRLLVNPNTLDGTNALEISQLVKQGARISLSALGAKKGFTPPKALALIRPGTENLVYNAPRYFHFGETLLKKAVSLLQSVGNSHEITRLQEQLTALARFPDLVLYSSQGMQKALQAQKALAILVPSNKFLIAYLNFTTEGTIVGSHLLFDSTSEDLNFPSLISLNDGNNQEKLIDTNEAGLLFSEGSNEETVRHPLLLQLTLLAHDRQQALKNISNEMVTLLESRNAGIANDFSLRFDPLLSQYMQIDQFYQIKVADGLEELYREYADMPLSQFVSLVKTAGLEVLARESLALRAEVQGSIITSEEILAQIQKIQKAKSFDQLDNAVTEAAEMLNLKHFPDPEKLISYQNEMRTQALQLLSRFMLSSHAKLPSSAFNKENRSILANILKKAWVIDPEEANFYLNEFELLCESYE